MKYTLETIKISAHAQERYAERIMDKDTKLDVAAFVTQHKQKIKEDIFKMIQYGTLLYSGKPNYEFNKQPVDIYLNGTWVIIVDIAKSNVVTLYSIDLGLGKEFNQEYIGKLLEKLNTEQKIYDEHLIEIQIQRKTYSELILSNREQINQYQQMIKALEKQNVGYQDVIDTLDCNRIVAEANIRDIVAKLIGKKVF